jgi:hypothetical protein
MEGTMNINVNSFLSHGVYYLKKSILPTDQQKKILVIVVLAFSCLTACYLLCRRCFGKLNGQGKIIQPTGEVWEGEFKDGKLHGPGKITFIDGEIWEGRFNEHRLVEGKKISSEGRVVQEIAAVWEQHLEQKDGKMDFDVKKL